MTYNVFGGTLNLAQSNPCSWTPQLQAAAVVGYCRTDTATERYLKAILSHVTYNYGMRPYFY